MDTGPMAGSIEVIRGDITQQDVEAIVNAANTTLRGGGGVDGAIHRAAGPGLLKECEKLGGCPTGDARITNGYNLRARYVIHTVGPIWRGGTDGESALLTRCYHNSLKVAVENGVRSIAFPSISTGVYGYPLGPATAIAVNTVTEFLGADTQLSMVRFVCFGQDSFTAYQDLLKRP